MSKSKNRLQNLPQKESEKLFCQCMRYADIKNLKKIDFDDVLTFIEEIASLKNGTLEVKIKDCKATIFIRHQKTYPRRTKKISKK